MSQVDKGADSKADLSIATDKVCFIVVKAREFDAKDLVTEPDPGSNPTDDRMIAILEDHKDDPVYREVAAFIGALSEDEQIDLVALAWLGRGDGTIEDWSELRVQAASEHNRRTARYLLGLPLFVPLGLVLFKRFKGSRPAATAPANAAAPASAAGPGAAPAAASAAMYYYNRQGQTLGPVPLDQLRELAAAGQLTPQDYVCVAGNQQWVAASTVAGIF